ncbi:MAG: D-alanyl-D-alanine carboxypeptidase [Paracoccaceae bacterium]|nr:D-alanyl-D-alanine carboxypeptidase [Paracoccaceae bacterium]
MARSQPRTGRPAPVLQVLLVALALSLLPALQTAKAQPQTTPARAAFLIDLSSGAVLLEKDADTPLPPASMSKLMTLEIVFDALRNGRLKLEDNFRTSARAAAMGGSKMFIRSGEVVSIQDLLRGVIVQSGNDAAVALAEAISGTEESFAQLMNQRAGQLGLANSNFVNSTGWPAAGHEMSLRDLAILAERLVDDYPDYYPIFAETSFTWDGITQSNRNPLLDLDIGADGLKTGHTEEAGYGLVASAERDGRRVVLVIAGLDSNQARSQEAERLINWAFRAFETRRLLEKGQTVATAKVWIGDKDSVGLATADELVVTVPVGSLEQAQMRAHFNEPVAAPVEAGAELGRLEVTIPDVTPVSVPLVAVELVERGGVGARFGAAARLLMRRLLEGVAG